jgi:hypothetical protein
MSTTGSNRVVRWLVIAVLSVATGGMVLVSLRANYLFGYGFGQTEEKARVFGCANVAADLWKVAGLVVIMGLWRAQHSRTAITLAPLWMLCLAWGMVGAIGVYAQDRTTFIGGRQAKLTAYRERANEFAELDGKLTNPSTSRSVNEVDAAIEAILAQPVMRTERVVSTVGKLSARCSNDDRRTADACAQVARLRQERATAQHLRELETRRAELRRQLDSLREDGASTLADPVAELFAWLSRGQLSVRDIAFGFPLAFALLVELVSALGPAAVVAYADATRGIGTLPGSSAPDRVMPRHGGLRLVPARRDGQAGSVLAWVGERAAPSSDARAMGIDELHADYEAWCAENGLNPLPSDAFGEDFDRLRSLPEMGGKIRKFGSRYFGIALVGEHLETLPAQDA